MITDKEIVFSRKIIQQLLLGGWIVSADRKYFDFFLNKAEITFQTAQMLFKISQENKLKELLGQSQEFNSYLWVINTGYYSMFYAATALLAKFNHRIKKEQGKHILTYHALVYYFLDNDKKLTKHILENYKQAEQEASEALQIAEKLAREKIHELKLELEKRRTFTYEMGRIAEENKAQTSLQRAKEFLTLVKEQVYK